MTGSRNPSIIFELKISIGHLVVKRLPDAKKNDLITYLIADFGRMYKNPRRCLDRYR